ncbi:MAG TPA: hypothetical protein VFI42_18550 [Thermomicrobiaceae bacterium]|nr:hypothetical protein [Thermomicrobiaceae bacterium]
MNIVDLLVILVFLGVFALAFFVGVVRSLAMLIALAVGVLGASIACGTIGGQLVSRIASMSDDMGRLIAFVILLALIVSGVYYVLMRSFSVSRLRTRITTESRGGITLSLVLVVLSAMLAVGVVTILTQASERTIVDLQPNSTVVSIDHQFRDSLLADQVRHLTPYLYEGVGDVLHTTAPQILLPVGR